MLHQRRVEWDISITTNAGSCSVTCREHELYAAIITQLRHNPSSSAPAREGLLQQGPHRALSLPRTTFSSFWVMRRQRVLVLAACTHVLVTQPVRQEVVGMTGCAAWWHFHDRTNAGCSYNRPWLLHIGDEQHGL